MLNELDFLKLPCPKLSWDKNDYKLVLYYYVGIDFGICKFKFDYYNFLALYNSSKGRDKLSDIDFMRRLGASNSSAPFLALVLKFYQLNPTVCKKAIHQDKKKARKISLKLKKGAVDKLHGISKPRGKNAAIFKPRGVVVDQDKVNTLIFLMNDCVRKAAASWSLQGFDEYKRLYSDLMRANGSSSSGFISKAKENAIFKDFSSKVASLQK